MVQPRSRSQKMQSPLAFSRSDSPRRDRLVYNPVTSARVSPRNEAMAPRSASPTQTKPGSPVQQLPQRVQEKRRPSLYQGAGSADMVAGPGGGGCLPLSYLI